MKTSSQHISVQPKALVIKIGGALLSNEGCLLAVFEQIAEVQQQGVAVTLVHGGGASVDQQLQAQGLHSEKHQGQRVTPKAHMPIVAGALAGYVNKQLVATAAKTAIQAVGLSLADGDLCTAIPVESLGQVATTEPLQSSLLHTLIQAKFLPIVSSIAAGNGELFNVNADIAAATVAQLLKADLLMLSDTPGVLNGDSQLLPRLTSIEINRLVEQGVIQGGMQVKVDAALHAAKTLQRCVSILDWHDSSVIIDWFNGQSVGTKIVPEQ